MSYAVPGSTTPASDGKGPLILGATVSDADDGSAPAGTFNEKPGGWLITPPAAPMVLAAASPSANSKGSR